MEKSILLHCLSTAEFKAIIKDVVKEELVSIKKDLENKGSDILLTRTEVCDLMKISKTTLWKWTKNGKITAYGMGNRVYFKKQELLKSLIILNK